MAGLVYMVDTGWIGQSSMHEEVLQMRTPGGIGVRLISWSMLFGFAGGLGQFGPDQKKQNCWMQQDVTDYTGSIYIGFYTKAIKPVVLSGQGTPQSVFAAWQASVVTNAGQQQQDPWEVDPIRQMRERIMPLSQERILEAGTLWGWRRDVPVAGDLNLSARVKLYLEE